MADSGIERLEEFAESAREAAGKGKSGGVDKAKRDAFRGTINGAKSDTTAKGFKDTITDKIRNASTGHGAPYDSRNDMYETGTGNDSSTSNVHISNKAAWNHAILSDNEAVIYPHPSAAKRVGFFEEGTSSHGPARADKMLFFLYGDPVWIGPLAESRQQESGWVDGDYVFPSETPSTTEEVSGVDEMSFIEKTYKRLDSKSVLKRNMDKEIHSLLRKHFILYLDI